MLVELVAEELAREQSGVPVEADSARAAMKLELVQDGLQLELRPDQHDSQEPHEQAAHGCLPSMLTPGEPDHAGNFKPAGVSPTRP